MYHRRETDCRDLEAEVNRLKADAEDARYRQERQRDEEERDRKERERERREQQEQEMRSASTWPEALRKQIILHRRELSSTMFGQPLYGQSAHPDAPEDDFFGPGALACERALVIWKEVEATKQEAIKALEDAITNLKDSIRFEVAQKLAEEGTDKPLGWKSVASSLADSDTDLERWLDW
jgi:hypothetical protein